MQQTPSLSVVIVTGPPGTGKSALAARLVPRFDLIPLEKDVLKEAAYDALGRNPGPAQRPGSRALSDLSFALLFALARQIGRPGARLLLEGNFRPAEHEPALRALGSGVVPLRFAQILCRCEEALRVTRLAARAGAAHRHAAHDDARGGAPADARSGAGMLDLPGERLIYDSGAADPDRAFEVLCGSLARWFD
jgi:predicted kinase